MKIFIASKEEGKYALPLSPLKASWRDLHSLIKTGRNQESSILNHAARVGSTCGKSYRLNVVGLATDPGKAGKFLMWRHDRMSLPAELVADEDMAERLSQGMDSVEFVAEELRRRIYEVTKSFLTANGSPDPKDVQKLTDAIDPRRAFWARMETHFAAFVAGLDGDENHAVEALKQWREAAEREGESALRESCDSLGHSGRAIKATARVAFRFEADRQAVMQKIDAAKQKKNKKNKGETA